MKISPTTVCAPRIITILFLSFLILAVSAKSYGQSQNSPPNGHLIKINAVQVNVYVIAQDHRGHMVTRLDKQDFALTDNGTRQQIRYFSRETNTPLSLGLLLDTSASQASLLDTERKAANLFLSSVLQDSDQAFVMRFDVDSEVLQDFTRDPSLLTQALDDARINTTGRSILPESQAVPSVGGTHLYDAVYLASNELMKTRYGRKVLVLVTDGEDQGSTMKLFNALEAAEKADVIIYSIRVSDPLFYEAADLSYHGTSTLEKLAKETGGSAIATQSLKEIGPAFAKIANELRAQYVLGYTPSNMSYDGSFHRLRVTVPGHRYVLRTRRGYYAPATSAQLSP